MKNELIKFFIKIGITAGIIFVVIHFFLGFHIYHGNNMTPWLKDGDLIIVNKQPKIYSDIVVTYKVGEDLHYGRIIGVSGDEINIDSEKHYTINGSIPLEKVYYDTYTDNSSIEFPVTVGNNQVFVLNDMREDLRDSRTFGCIDITDIEGSVIFSVSRRGF